MALPRPPLFGVDHHLVAVPGLDRGDEPELAQMADLDLAASALWALPWVSFGDLHRPVGQEHADAEKVRCHELLAAPMPADRRDAVEDAAGLGGVQFALPLTRTVEVHRHVVRVVRRGGLGPDHWCHQQNLLAVALEVDPAKTVDGGDAVDLPGRPGLPRVRPALEDEHVADALFRYGLEVVPHCDFGNAVAVVIVNVEIDGARHVLDDYVALPRWILVPGEFSAALVYHDEVRPAVAVQVGGYKLIAHLQGVSNRGLLPLRQFHARRRRNQQDEQYTQHQPNFTRNGVTKEVALFARLPPLFHWRSSADPLGTSTKSGEATRSSITWVHPVPPGPARSA